MKGICLGCGEEHELVDYMGSIVIGTHTGNYANDRICSGAYCPSRLYECPVCGEHLLRRGAHFKKTSGLLCDGVAVKYDSSVTESIKESVRDYVRNLASEGTRTYPTSFALIPGSAVRPKKTQRTTAPDGTVTGIVQEPCPYPGCTASHPEKEELELCKGGPHPAAGCKICGDKLYMTVTGREGECPPVSYDSWRLEHDKTGLPWAKDRMLDHMKEWHNGVLDENWKPLPVTEDPQLPVNRTHVPVLSKNGITFALLGIMWLIFGIYTRDFIGAAEALLGAFCLFMAVGDSQIQLKKRRHR